MNDQNTLKPSEIMMEEYKLLWTYYITTLNERKNLFDYYFKAVTIPAGVIGLARIIHDRHRI